VLFVLKGGIPVLLRLMGQIVNNAVEIGVKLENLKPHHWCIGMV
jgi:hypothetical protein